MRVRIRLDLCQGHSMCRLCCPEVFHLSEEDAHAYVKDDKVPPGLEPKVRRAQQSCPEQAIEIFSDKG